MTMSYGLLLNEARRYVEQLGGWQLIALALLAGLILTVSYSRSNTHIDIPAVGVPPGILGSWKAALLWVSHSEAFLSEGVREYAPSGAPFKVSTPSRWLVFITNREIMKEIKNATEAFSFNDAFRERLSARHTFSDDLFVHPYHLDIISKRLSQKLTTVIPEVLDEITMAFEENVDIGSDWTPIDNFNVMLKSISRTTSKIFVGLPLGRNQDYLDKAVAFATIASKAGHTIDMVPEILKPIVSWFVMDKGAALKKVLDDIGPIFLKRKQKMEELGDRWTDRPNDAIQWILDLAPPDSSIDNMCMRILFLNFTAIHTSTISITQVLLDLGAHPEFQEPLREEIESVLREFGGWTKQALTKMKKLDSCMRESQRLNGVVIGTAMRKATVSQSLSDGTFIPKGTWVFVPSGALHRSEILYENPLEFDPFRYSRMREQPGHEAKHQLVSVDENNLGFGLGNHACPGRFFAANELKVLLAFIICNYEFKTPTSDRPKNGFYATSCFPDPSKHLLFRERVDREHSSVNRFK